MGLIGSPDSDFWLLSATVDAGSFVALEALEVLVCAIRSLCNTDSAGFDTGTTGALTPLPVDVDVVMVDSVDKVVDSVVTGATTVTASACQ